MSEEGMKKKTHYNRTWIKTPTVYQMEATECGAASLTMVMGYFGKHIPLEQMRIETGVSRDGCNARNILNAARKFGLECKGYTKGLEDALKMKPPCILHWNFNHFVVYEGMKGGHPYINDPAVGRRKLTIEEFDDAFTGIMLCFEKTESFEKTKKISTLPAFVKQRLQGQKKTVAALLGAGLLLVVPGLVLPVFSQVFVDDILLSGNTGWLGALLAAMGGTVLFQALFMWLRSKVLTKLQLKMSLTSAHQFLYRLFRLPISFFDQRYSGDLSQRVANNNNVSNFLAGELAQTVLNVIVASFYLILMLLYSPVLTLLGVAGVAFTITVSYLSAYSLSTLSMKSQQDQGKMVGTFYSGLAITSTLKASGSEKEYVSRILGYYAKNATSEQKIGKMQEILSAAPQAVSQFVNILVLMIGGGFVIKGNITAGMLVAFSQLLSSFTSPVNQLVGFFQKIQTLKADLNRVQDIEKYQVAAQFEKDRQELQVEEKLEGEVELKNVSFGYSALKPPLIQDFCFKAEPGRTVALVGSSGCGKSTVAKLISGLYDPWEGQVLVDGMELRKLPSGIVCASVATVSQSISLFTGTIRDNLTLWNKKVMEQDIVRAAKDACIHDTITRLPGAYDYILSEEGSNLSGGQRQRLEIARALIANPTVLVMDEATSALDPIVEKQIVDNIKRRGCTCIIVAHRLSTIRDCDEILVMEHGKIVQRGNHAKLCKEDGLYSTLIRNE